MFLAPQPLGLSFSLYITVAGAVAMFRDAGIESVRELAPAIENHGLGSVQALAPIVQQIDNLAQRLTYALMSALFLCFVFVVLAGYSMKARGLWSVVLVLVVGFLIFIFTLLFVSWPI